MENLPLDNSSSEKSEKDTKDEKDKKSKRLKKGAFAVSLESKAKETGKKPEPTDSEKKAIGNLLFQEQSKAKSAEEKKPKDTEEKAAPELAYPAQPQPGFPGEQATSPPPYEAAQQNNSAAEDSKETEDIGDEADTENVRETFTMPERLPLDMLGTEVVINLRGNSRPEPEAAKPSAASEPAEAFQEPDPAVVYNTQPQQQHQGRQEAPTESTLRPAASEVPSVSSSESGFRVWSETQSTEPENLLTVAEYPALQPTSVESYRQQMGPNVVYEQPTVTTPNSVSSKYEEQLVTQKELEERVYYAEKTGQNRGVAAGLLVAGYEHFKHRRREKKMKKTAIKQTKQFEKERKNTNWQLAEQAKQINQTEHELQQLQREQVAPTPLSEAAPRPVAAENTRFSPYEQSQERHEQAAFKQQLEKILPKKEQQVAVEAAKDGKLEIPADHHLETSAWHTIEIDSKTGKAVENPTFAYGQEYYHERAQEVGPRDDAHNAAAGEVALVAAAQIAQDPASAATQQAALDQSSILLASVRNQTKPAAKFKQAAKQTMQTSGPLWPLVVAFVVVVILIIIAL